MAVGVEDRRPMKRAYFLRALCALPFAPAALEGLTEDVQSTTIIKARDIYVSDFFQQLQDKWNADIPFIINGRYVS